MIKAVIFDLDDTLYDESEYVMEGFRKVCDYLHDSYGKDTDTLFNRMKEILYQRGRGKIFNQICEEFNIKEDVHNLVKVYRNTKPNIRLYEDSIQCIEYLKLNKILTGLITDGASVVQHSKIEALSLDKKLDYIIVTDDYGRENWKPSIFAYNNMIEHFELAPQEMVYIGDNSLKDFIGAKQVGMHTIRIIREKGDYMNNKISEENEAEYIIKSLKEVVDIISGLN